MDGYCRGLNAQIAILGAPSKVTMGTLEYLNLALRFSSVSQAILLLVYIGLSNNPARVKVVSMMFLLGSISYLVMPTVDRHMQLLEHFGHFWFFSSIAPSMLLLLVWFIFEEECTYPLWILLLVGVSVLGSLYYQISGVGLPGSPLWLQVLKGFIALSAVFIVWYGRDNDLVELRSKIRVILVLILSIETTVIVIVEGVTHYSPPILLDTILVFLLFLCFITTSFLLLRLNPDGLFMRIESPISHETEDAMLMDLIERMERERLYADHDLRVGSLASMLNVPEYKLRQKINQELGYRNFNQFVNRYRVEEAGSKLIEDARTPVLSIALDVGFRSISSFNTAFQAHFGVSPTKYRSESLPES